MRKPNHITNKILDQWAAAYPDQAIKLGVNGEIDGNKLSDHRSLTIRQGVYRACADNPQNISKHLATSPSSLLLSERVLDDLENHQAQPLIQAVAESCQKSGGRVLFGHEADRPLDNNFFAKLVEATPEAGKEIYKRNLQQYIGITASRATNSSEQLARSFTFDHFSSTADQLNQEQIDWIKRSDQYLAGRILAGQREAAIIEQEKRIAKIIAANFQPQWIDNMPSLNDGSPAARSFEMMKRINLANHKPADHHLQLNKNELETIIGHSLDAVGGNPFDIQLNSDDFVARISYTLEQKELAGN